MLCKQVFLFSLTGPLKMNCSVCDKVSTSISSDATTLHSEETFVTFCLSFPLIHEASRGWRGYYQLYSHSWLIFPTIDTSFRRDAQGNIVIRTLNAGTDRYCKVPCAPCPNFSICVISQLEDFGWEYLVGHHSLGFILEARQGGLHSVYFTYKNEGE